VASLIGLLIGWRARVFARAAWLFHLVLVSGQITAYGVDMFAHIFLFYLCLFPSGWGDSPSSLARFGIRLLQLHLCIAYFFCGYEKAQGPQWWDGDAIWRPLMLPLYSSHDMSWLASYPWLAKLAGWGTLVVEGAYPIFIWPRVTRYLWALLVISLHLGIGVFLGLGIFSLFMSVLTLSLFCIPAVGRVNPPARSALNHLAATFGAGLCRASLKYREDSGVGVGASLPPPKSSRDLAKIRPSWGIR
jgi:hypothetical protein